MIESPRCAGKGITLTFARVRGGEESRLDTISRRDSMIGVIEIWKNVFRRIIFFFFQFFRVLHEFAIINIFFCLAL